MPPLALPATSAVIPQPSWRKIPCFARPKPDLLPRTVGQAWPDRSAAAGTMSDILLEVDGVTLQYKTPQQLVTATYRVSFEVHQGDRFVILGPSGCGKSTMLKAVGGFMRPVEGSIKIRGRAVESPGPDRMMVFQEFEQLMPWKTVLQNVLFPMQTTGKFPRAEANERALAFIEKVKLTKFRNVYPHMLSGGMKMRVAIARAMALEPDRKSVV